MRKLIRKVEIFIYFSAIMSLGLLGYTFVSSKKVDFYDQTGNLISEVYNERTTSDNLLTESSLSQQDVSNLIIEDQDSNIILSNSPVVIDGSPTTQQQVNVKPAKETVKVTHPSINKEEFKQVAYNNVKPAKETVKVTHPSINKEEFKQVAYNNVKPAKETVKVTHPSVNKEEFKQVAYNNVKPAKETVKVTHPSVNKEEFKQVAYNNVKPAKETVKVTHPSVNKEEFKQVAYNKKSRSHKKRKISLYQKRKNRGLIYSKRKLINHSEYYWNALGRYNTKVSKVLYKIGTYKVKAGDSIRSIGRKFFVRAINIVAINKTALKDPDVLTVGQIIKIPNK